MSSKTRLSGEERRSQILEVAINIFSEKGFSGSRIKEIAELADISETLIFQHFSSKEDLYKAALQDFFKKHPLMPEIEPMLKIKDDAGVFSSLARHLIINSRNDPRIIRVALFAALEGMHFDEILNEDAGTLSKSLARYIQQRIKDGAFRKINTSIAARLFIETVYMYTLDQHAAISGPVLPNSDEEIIKTLVSIFLNGITS